MADTFKERKLIGSEPTLDTTTNTNEESNKDKKAGNLPSEKHLVIKINNVELTKFDYKGVDKFTSYSDKLSFIYYGVYKKRFTRANLNKNNVISWSFNLNKEVDAITLIEKNTQIIYYTSNAGKLTAVSGDIIIENLNTGSDVYSYIEYVPLSNGKYAKFFTTLNKNHIIGVFTPKKATD